MHTIFFSILAHSVFYSLFFLSLSHTHTYSNDVQILYLIHNVSTLSPPLCFFLSFIKGRKQAKNESRIKYFMCWRQQLFIGVQGTKEEAERQNTEKLT
jgi:hypothetical protein